MMENLPEFIPNYPGAEARVRCFCHIINLVCKSILSQFNAPSKHNRLFPEGDRDRSRSVERDQSFHRHTDANDIVARDEIEADELETQDEENERGLETDNVEGWVDERDVMDGGQLAELDTSVEPARQMLSKVNNAYLVPHLC